MIDNKRIKILREYIGVNQTDFAKAINSTQNWVSQLESDRVRLSGEVANHICTAYKVNKDWLLYGKGEMLEKTAVAEPTTEYKSNAKHMIAELEGGRPNMYIVPVKAFGGFLTGYENTVYMKSLEKAYFPFVRGTCFGFEVDGVSMMNDEKERSYRPGSWVVCTPIDNFSWLVKNKDYVFQTIDGIIIKRFVKVEKEYCHLTSINEDYNPVKPIHMKSIKVIYFVERKTTKP